MMIFWEIDNYTLDIHSILEAKFRNNLCTKKIKFFIKDFFSKCDQIRRKLRNLVTFTEEILNETI